MTDNPEIAIVFAESPSVKISVHSSDFFVPAQLASSNLGIFLFWNAYAHHSFELFALLKLGELKHFVK